MAIAITAQPPMRLAVHARCSNLDAKTFPLTPHGAAQILELNVDRIVDRFACSGQVLRNMLANLVAWNPFPQCIAAVCCPTSSDGAVFDCTPPGPSRTTSEFAEHRCQRPVPGRTAPQHVGQACADRYTDQRGGEEIVFVFMIMLACGFRRADGHAGLLGASARLIRNCCRRHRLPPESQSRRLRSPHRALQTHGPSHRALEAPPHYVARRAPWTPSRGRVARLLLARRPVAR